MTGTFFFCKDALYRNTISAILYQILIRDDHGFLHAFFFVPLNCVLIERQYKINMVATGSNVMF